MEPEEIVKHYGVKGMKWGVRRYQPYREGDGQKGKGKFLGKVKDKASNSRVGQEIRSRKREIDAIVANMDVDNMSTQEIRDVSRRMQLENSLKKNTPKVTDVKWTKKGREQNRKERQDYRNRARMSDAELKRKVERLQAKEMLKKNTKTQTKETIEAGKKVATMAASLGAKYYTDGSLGFADFEGAYDKPKTEAVINLGKIAVAKGLPEETYDIMVKRLKRQSIIQSVKMDTNTLQHINKGDSSMELKDMTLGELHHHGVKGMKWGVRRYQPYREGDGQKGKGRYIGDKIKKVATITSGIGTAVAARYIGSAAAMTLARSGIIRSSKGNAIVSTLLGSTLYGVTLAGAARITKKGIDMDKEDD